MTPRFPRLLPLAGLLLVAGLSACATAPAPAPSGRWRPVNRFGSAPEAIPLQPAYLYYAAPVDRTLKGLLERWAADSHLALDYRHPADFTLYQRVSEVRSDDLRTAIGQLNALYAAQQVAVSVEGDRIVVRRPGSTPPAAAGSASAHQR